MARGACAPSAATVCAGGGRALVSGRVDGQVSRLRRTLTGLLVLPAGLLLASPAFGIPLTPSQDPLPGSAFQGADGNQDDAAPRLDWQSLTSAGRVQHSPDPNAQDTAFEGGSREDEPGLWDFAIESGGVNPGKANILDAWTAVDDLGADTFVSLGFAREVASLTRAGTTFITFELNHDPRLWNNGQATIPCRRTGDLLVSYEAHGNDVDVVLQQWITSQTDLATGCATRGSLTGLTGLTPNEDVQGAVNAGAITNWLPGFYQGSVPSERFGEAALNLSRILQDAVSDECFSFASIWMHSRSSTSESSNMQDYVAPHRLAVRSCAASGTKFHDLDADGVRDSNEPGLPRWLIWADYDDDGTRDAVEPFGITDTEGQYVINDIRPPDGTYMLRETLATVSGRRRATGAGVVCSYPNASTPGGTGSAPGGLFGCAWGPIATATTTVASGRDFGNYAPARLTIEKELEPAGDPGRFDLLVNGTVAVAAAGDGASRSESVRPGEYTLSEVAVTGTNPADYSSSVECKLGTRRTEARAGGVYASLQLASGESATCTFRNVRLGAPAIAIDKTGPATATPGDTLSYTLFVTNPGDIPFPEAAVRVTDPGCDDPPTLVGKTDGSGPDDSPGTLDPGDTWTYSCSRETVAREECAPANVPNTASVIATPGPVGDSSSIVTSLLCPPPEPQPPDPPGPQPPDPPRPVIPPGPEPPDSGNGGTAGARVPAGSAGCVRARALRVNLRVARVARVRVSVDGRRVRGRAPAHAAAQRGHSTQAPAWKAPPAPRRGVSPGNGQPSGSAQDEGPGLRGEGCGSRANGLAALWGSPAQARSVRATSRPGSAGA